MRRVELRYSKPLDIHFTCQAIIEINCVKTVYEMVLNPLTKAMAAFNLDRPWWPWWPWWPLQPVFSWRRSSDESIRGCANGRSIGISKGVGSKSRFMSLFLVQKPFQKKGDCEWSSDDHFSGMEILK